MGNASTTATTGTGQITAAPNVHYSLGGSAGQTFQVSPHAPTER